MDRESVVVVGAGPVGLAMAAELARHGVRPRVIDAAEGTTTHSKALVVHARSLELLERMGCVDGFLEAGLRCTRVGFYAKDRHLGHLSLADMPSRHRGALLVPQSVTERLLEEHLEGLGVTVERLTRVTALAQDPDAVHLEAEGPGGRETIEADWLVGCDGARSMVRNALGLSFEGTTLEGTWLLGDVMLDWPLPAEEMAFFMGADGAMAFFPFGGGRARIMFAVDDARDAAIDPAETECLLAERGPTGARMREHIWGSRFTINERMVGTFGRGRCFVAGDAAHIHSPAGGQGLNTGIQDAANLAWKLAAVVTGRAAAAPLLGSYSAERSPVAADVLSFSHRLLRPALVGGRVRALVRDAGVMAMLRSPVASRMRGAMSELGIGYEDGPLSVESGRRQGLRAGARLPDAPLAGADGPVRLHELMRASVPVLLLLGGDSMSPGHPGLVALATTATGMLGDGMEAFVVSQGPAPEGPGGAVRTLSDADGVLHREVRASGPTALVVRPDGYVGLRLEPPSLAGIVDYMSTVLGWRLGAPRRTGAAVPA